jgi:hypothetical protein
VGDLQAGSYTSEHEVRPATAFPFKQISRPQFSGTVPMIHVNAHSAWLVKQGQDAR